MDIMKILCSPRTIVLFGVAVLLFLVVTNSLQKLSVKKQNGPVIHNPMIINDDDDLEEILSDKDIYVDRIFNQSDAIIYNRVPKTGSRVVYTLIGSMSRKHHFNYMGSTNYLDYRPTKNHLLQQLSDLQAMKRPWLFERHIYYFQMNQSQIGDVPLYINIVREPISRCISWYYFIRFEHQRNMTSERRKRTFDDCIEQGLDECTKPYEAPYRCLQLPFFCGHDDVCVTPNKAALEQAKRNAATKYAIIGLMEDMRSFFKVIEKLSPNFFGGVLQEYDKFGEKYQHDFSNQKHKSESMKTTVKMEEIMSIEIEFYRFVKKLFYHRHRKIL